MEREADCGSVLWISRYRTKNIARLYHFYNTKAQYPQKMIFSQEKNGVAIGNPVFFFISIVHNSPFLIIFSSKRW